MVTPCSTRMKNPQNSTAPTNCGTKCIPESVTLLKYFAMKPQRIMSMATQMNSGSTREKLPRIDKNGAVRWQGRVVRSCGPALRYA